MSKEDFIKEVESMTVMELNELVKALEEKFGVSASAPMMMAAAPAAGAAATEEKTSFDVVLTNAGGNKIPVIKVIREITNLGLKEAKDIADNTPKPVKTGVAKDEADKIKKQLEEAGATVELK
ncbi:MAG: 50S ribosomal protein L7/L12 [Candidatus Goldiibacteriota bacterium HGW-Goldbacteria-1]|nr:MAG: 50S ribosomal protein L7/L12 [Candidatus Goldiibacteriota bacterium HGW-Goldbacteria-1]